MGKKEYTEADRMIQELRQDKERMKNEKEEADQKIRSLNARLESEQQEHEKALAGLQTEIKTLKENETSQSSNDEVLRAQNEQFAFVGKVLSIPGAVEIFYSSPLNLVHYADTIENPMWFSKIMENISSDEYNDWDQFVSDCRLVFTNALQYNCKYFPGDVKRFEQMQANVEEYIKE